ncbi:hypothetical protein DEO72_LG11g1561 [Vigna unguiculata]|uniref:Uncharacterized protein n=1 Tax=Vigna unguiculata TaxID=3917 RepID=A0A4D6NMJ3_VIGUN|nr:hypothetical protein DEO72_LG11g1561 [Vigna unguiculata]
MSDQHRNPNCFVAPPIFRATSPPATTILSSSSVSRSFLSATIIPTSSRIVGKPRGKQLKVLYPKCNKQEDSWECGYYVMF